MSQQQIDWNVRAYKRLCGKYNELHGEIFNDIEQARLNRALADAVNAMGSEPGRMRALDFGCGSGNLTRHLLSLGLNVVAADVSPHFLRLLEFTFRSHGRSLRTVRLNGHDLSGLPDDHFDLAATYSVLHHVPDYLGAVREMARVVKPGGLLYIDHEQLEESWITNSLLQEFFREASPPPPIRTWRRFLEPRRYWGKIQRIRLLVRRRWNPRYMPEGDIHVWPDDHIEWNKIEGMLEEMGWETIFKDDYLLYKRWYAPGVYERYRCRTADMRLLVVRKPRATADVGQSGGRSAE